MPTVTVSNAAELKSALSTLTSGGTLMLRAGSYGDLDIRDFHPTGRVMVTSADTSSAAHLDTVNIIRSSNMSFSNLDVGRPLNAGEPDYKNLIYAEGSDQLAFTKLFVHGSLDGDPGNDGQGLIVRNSTSIAITASHFEDLHRAVAVSMSSKIMVDNNKITLIAEDGIGFAQVKSTQISNNSISNFQAIKGHPDAIQFGTTGTTVSSEGIVIRDNVVLQGNGQPIQGLFMRDEIGTLPFKNVTVMNNLFYTDQYNGIVLQHAQSVNISGNSTLSLPGDGIDNRIWLKDVIGGNISHNVADAYIMSNVADLYLDSNNVDLSKSGTAGLFPNLSAGPNATIEDLLTKGGYQPDAGAKTSPTGAVAKAVGASITDMLQRVESAGLIAKSAMVGKAVVSDMAAEATTSSHTHGHFIERVPSHFPWLDHWQIA